jgi:hypothetical protein
MESGLLRLPSTFSDTITGKFWVDRVRMGAEGKW